MRIHTLFNLTIHAQVAADTACEAGAPLCIMCHESSGKNICYMGLAQRSTVLAHAVTAAPEHELLHKQFLVVGDQGCQVHYTTVLLLQLLPLEFCAVAAVGLFLLLRETASASVTAAQSMLVTSDASLLPIG
jgi:hypothetical protein